MLVMVLLVHFGCGADGQPSPRAQRDAVVVPPMDAHPADAVSTDIAPSVFNPGEGWALADAHPAPIALAPRPWIRLRWVPSYNQDSQERAATGLKWALSLLGAHLHPNQEADLITWHSKTHMDVNFVAAGMTAQALTALNTLCKKLRDSEEYAVRGGIDLGRFLLLTLGTSAHYYRITGTPQTYAAFKAQHSKPTHTVNITASLVAKEDRRLMGGVAAQAREIAWVAEEGSGQISDGSFKVIERETLDVMANGQLRFAVYGVDGQLRPAGDPNHSVAGKPARCMWCHESGLQRAWLDNSVGKGGMTRAEFHTLVDKQTLLLQQLRTNTPQSIGLDVQDKHIQMELIYVAFMEPTVERLAAEWGLPVAQVRSMTAGMRRHTEMEYRAWLQPSLSRGQVASLVPYAVVRVPSDPLEPAAFEPDYLTP